MKYTISILIIIHWKRIIMSFVTGKSTPSANIAEREAPGFLKPACSDECLGLHGTRRCTLLIITFSVPSRQLPMMLRTILPCFNGSLKQIPMLSRSTRVWQHDYLCTSTSTCHRNLLIYVHHTYDNNNDHWCTDNVLVEHYEDQAICMPLHWYARNYNDNMNIDNHWCLRKRLYTTTHK